MVSCCPWWLGHDRAIDRDIFNSEATRIRKEFDKNKQLAPESG